MPGCFSWLSVWLLILAQVMISQFVESSSESGSALRVRSLLGILSPLPVPPSDHACMHLFLSQKKETLKKVPDKNSVRYKSALCKVNASLAPHRQNLSNAQKV